MDEHIFKHRSKPQIRSLRKYQDETMPMTRYLNRFMKLPMPSISRACSNVGYRTNSSLPNPNHPSPETPVDSFETNTPRIRGGVNTPTALQKHVTFFDRNRDGKITLSESFQGLSALGFGSVRSGALAVAINTGLGRSTGAPWYSPFTINVDKIHQGKHGSDTDIYDVNGVFNQAKFNELFSKYDTNQDHALSKDELQGFFSRNFEDSTGSLASKAEFGLLLEIAGQDQVIAGKQTRVLTRDTLSRFYDGTLLFDIAGETIPF